MAIVTRKDVIHIAKLSRLEFSEKELVSLEGSMNEILQHIKALEKIDTSNIDGLSLPLGKMREDIPHTCLTQEEILKNAPVSDGKGFIVPKVVE
ncbi:MAG: Asp-tRNA(Asn)/Glu-tRNA(Gln) amidotransferase subunit GatC [Clostridia bacterium]